jgi:hypothetical protein
MSNLEQKLFDEAKMRETHRAKKFLAVMLQKYFLQGMGSL